MNNKYVSVRFVGLTPTAEASPSLFPDSPVAIFELEDGTRREVMYRNLFHFTDVEVRHWPAEVRCGVLRGLSSSIDVGRDMQFVRDPESQFVTRGRYAFLTPRDPAWLTTLAGVDARVIKVLAQKAAGRHPRDSNGLAGDPAQLLRGLREIGVPLPDDQALLTLSGDALDRLDLYADLDRAQVAACAEALSQVRERFLHNVVLRTQGEWPMPPLEIGKNASPRQRRGLQKFLDVSSARSELIVRSLRGAARVARSLDFCGYRAMHHTYARNTHAHFLIPDEKLRALGPKALLAGALYPGWDAVVRTLESAEEAILESGQPTLPRFTSHDRALGEVVDQVDEWRLHAVALASLGFDDLAEQVEDEASAMAQELVAHPAALRQLTPQRWPHLNTTVRRRTSIWNVVPREANEPGGIGGRVDPLFAEPPLSDDELVMVAYGTSDALLEARVVDELVANPRVKRRYDAVLEELDQAAA